MSEAPGPAGELASLLRGEPRAPRDEDALVAFAMGRRLGPELHAVARGGALSHRARMRLALERERAGVLAAARARTIERCDVALSRAAVPAVLMKGEAVVRLTHGDASRRPAADVDLLVAPEHRALATQALEAAGFARFGGDTPLHDVLVDPVTAGPAGRRGVPVEVHDDAFPRPHPFGLDVAGIVARAGRAGAGVRVPALPDALALTAFSFCFHETDGRKTWLVLRDLALLAHAVEASGRTAELREAAGKGGIGAATEGALRLAIAWAGAPPGAAEPLLGSRAETARRRTAVWLSLREIAQSIVDDPPRDRVLTRRVAAALWHPRGRDTLAALARAAVGGGGGGPRRRLARVAAALRRVMR